MLSAVRSSICARSICPFMLYLRAPGWKYLPQVFRSWRKKKVRTASSTAQMGASFSCLMRHEPQGSSRLASRENHCRLASIICWQHVSNWLNFLKRWSNSAPPAVRSCRVPLAIFLEIKEKFYQIKNWIRKPQQAKHWHHRAENQQNMQTTKKREIIEFVSFDN
jgi:hypothetical protein